ncbi:MAG: hypothetical protein ACLFOY_17760 [Desulfatibacillaceae bacterium]
MARKTVLVLFLLVFGAANAQAFPPSYVEKIRAIPDMTQTEPRYHLPGGGKQYCAPVAVSNSFMLLSRQGYVNLVPDSADPGHAQALVAGLLGSKRYMNTNLKNGTGPTRVLRGVSRFLEDCGYRYSYLGYQGWREHPSRFRTGVSVPVLDWIKDGMIGVSAVWLNVGWYKYDGLKDEYRRIGGHWVTLVGYGADYMGREDPDLLIVHNPASRGSGIVSHEYVRVEHMDSGRMIVDRDGDGMDAYGYHILSGDIPIRSRADCAILDGAIVLRM